MTLDIALGIGVGPKPSQKTPRDVIIPPCLVARTLLRRFQPLLITPHDPKSELSLDDALFIIVGHFLYHLKPSQIKNSQWWHHPALPRYQDVAKTLRAITAHPRYPIASSDWIMPLL